MRIFSGGNSIHMTTNDIDANDPFAFLAPYEFMLLSTYRRDGTAVPTTVWFAYSRGEIYVTTGKTAGKIKRVRNNGRVIMIPSDRVGNVLDQSAISGKAHEATVEEGELARAALIQKYGDRFQQVASQRAGERTYIVIEPAAS
jgi:uncharacterized protein